MKKIWILTFAEESEKGIFYHLSPDYVQMIENIWYRAVIIPYDSSHIEQFVHELDGFLIPWGRDVCPDYYFEEPNGAVNFCYIQDKSAFHLIDLVIQAKKPLFWICRGMQLINVFLWGTLHQHLDSHHIHNQYEKRYTTVHPITIETNSFLHHIFGDREILVNSVHHQAIKTLWSGLISSASHEDIEEAVEHQGLPIYGVQWHPEKLQEHARIFAYVYGDSQKESWK
jgi:putative glutamine amidotransferase